MVVGPSESHVTQARHLETVAVALLLRLLVATVILLGKVKTTVCKVVLAKTHQLVRLTTQILAHVAGRAVVLLKEFVTLLRLGCNGVVVATQILIKWRVRRQESHLKLLDCIGDICLRDTIGIDLRKGLLIVLILLKFCDNLIERCACHLNGVERRSCRLISQCCCTAIPKLHEIIYCVESRGGIHTTLLTLHTLRVLLVIYARHREVVARSARNGIINRESCVVIQLLTQHYLARIHGQRLGNGSHGLACKLISKAVVVVLHTICLRPHSDNITLGVGHLATPVHKEILRLRHTLVERHLLHLGNIHGVGLCAAAQRRHKRCDVVGTITLAHILLNQISRHGEVGIERKLGIRRVARKATTLLKNSQSLLAEAQARLGRTVHNGVDGRHRYGRRQQQNHDCTLFHNLSFFVIRIFHR